MTPSFHAQPASEQRGAPPAALFDRAPRRPPPGRIEAVVQRRIEEAVNGSAPPPGRSGLPAAA
jgi:hypothetical protein